MGQLGHAQAGDVDEVRGRTEAASRPFGLLQQAVHGFHKGVAAVIGHAAHHGVEALLNGGGQLLERLKPAAPRPAQSGAQISAGLLGFIVRTRAGVDLLQRHLQPPRSGALRHEMLRNRPANPP